MKALRPLLIITLIGFWAGGIIFLCLKEAIEQKRTIKSSGMVLIQGGCYEMGDPSGTGKDDEHPVHMVCVDPFYLGKEMVTVGAFKAFVAETGYRTDAERSGGCEVQPRSDSSPVVCVSWNDASQYIGWLQKKTPKKGIGYRLPTEGEWEFAAKNKREIIPDRMEWVEDWYGEHFYQEGAKTNPSGPSTGKYRVLRGGSPMNDPEKGSLFSRFYKEPDSSSNRAGFRLALPMTDR